MFIILHLNNSKCNFLEFVFIFIRFRLLSAEIVFILVECQGKTTDLLIMNHETNNNNVIYEWRKFLLVFSAVAASQTYTCNLYTSQNVEIIFLPSGAAQVIFHLLSFFVTIDDISNLTGWLIMLWEIANFRIITNS